MTKDEFVIPFAGLSSGNHSFDFEIDGSFFESFAYFEGTTGSLKARVELQKEPGLMQLNTSITGGILLTCDRCLDQFKMPLQGSFLLVIKFGEEYEEESDEVIVLPQAESRIDLGQYFFEYIISLLPIQKVHPENEDGESGCNPDMIERLNQFAKQKTDPRWDALKDIKLNK